jgi:hypothetical protein
MKRVLLSLVIASSAAGLTACSEVNFAKAVKSEKESSAAAENSVCPEPNHPCNHADKKFEDWELSFRLPEKIVAYKTYRSAPFYAVILKKLPGGCGELDVDPRVEEERIKIQSEFPSRKVFSENSCPNWSAVDYEFEGRRADAGGGIVYSDYIAVYAGATDGEAREALAAMREKYPQAEIKQMTAQYRLILR